MKTWFFTHHDLQGRGATRCPLSTFTPGRFQLCLPSCLMTQRPPCPCSHSSSPPPGAALFKHRKWSLPFRWTSALTCSQRACLCQDRPPAHPLRNPATDWRDIWRLFHFLHPSIHLVVQFSQYIWSPCHVPTLC